jgi:hypothetical protein
MTGCPAFLMAAAFVRRDRDSMTAKELYERDFYAWTQETARLLREGRFEKLDIKASLMRSRTWGRASEANSKTTLRQ